MRKGFIACLSAVAIVVSASSAAAQARGGIIGKAEGVMKKVDLMTFTQKEEEDLGAKISELLRQRYGVVQDVAVHKYVTLTGRVLAASSSRPALAWTFIVLDTDGVNAFAAPGGYVHITKGALALMRDEAELACVLGHEVGHIAEKHTLAALQKSEGVRAAASAAGQERMAAIAQAAFDNILDNKWDQKDELEADKVGITTADKAGYLASGLSTFLGRLAEGRKALAEPTGMFATYPKTQERVAAMTSLAVPPAFSGKATMTERFRTAIPFQQVALAGLAGAPGATAGTAAASQDSPEPPKKRRGLGGLWDKGKSVVTGKSDAPDTTTLANARGVNPDRDAKGGPDSRTVVVEVTRVEVEAFRKLIAAKGAA